MFRRGADGRSLSELEEQQRLQEEMYASRFSSNPATRLVFPSTGQRRADGDQIASGSTGAARGNPLDAAFMSMFGGNDTEGPASRAHALAGSPFYPRQPPPYHRPFMPAPYGGMPSPTDPYGRRSGYNYPPPPGASPTEQRYGQNLYGLQSQASRDHAAFYGRQRPSELSQAAILDRAYAAVSGEDDASAILAASTANKPIQPPTLQSSYLPKGQTPKSTPSAAAKCPGSRGGGGRGRGGRGRGRGRGRGGRGGRGSAATKSAVIKKEDAGPPPPPITWFPGTVPLGLAEDKFWLSELQVYLRSNFAEAFAATEEDIAAPMHGRNKPIALGQVGIRCMHCKNDPPSERGQQATSYPSLISGIYNSVQQMLRLHFDCCLAMPAEVRKKIESLKVSSSARGGRKQYWIDSSKRLGLVDTPHGIHFGRDPYGPLPPLEGPSVTSKNAAKMKAAQAKKEDAEKGEKKEETKEGDDAAVPPVQNLPPEELFPLVEPDDKNLISDYLYLTLEQMQPCLLMEADKVGCYKSRRVGFPGLACKHCVGQAGCGRYFPASEASLSQTTTSQTIMNHVRNCRRCPIEIRENLELMKRARMGPDGKRADKPKHGGRKVFFRRLWCRMQGLPMDDETIKPPRKNARLTKKRGPYTKRKGMRRSLMGGSDDDDDEEEEHDDDSLEGASMDEDEETETEDEDSVSSENESDELMQKSAAKSTKSKSSKKSPKSEMSKWYEGCVRLTKSDDPHWLSEMQCYARSDLVEVFSLEKNDSLDGYIGRKEPSVGQVGIRCAFCKSLPKLERPGGCVYFPDSLSSIHSKVSDLLRLHFPSCPSMPDDVKSTFKSLRGFGAKADGDAQQYWIDSARDIGLSDIPTSPSGWGLTFRRDPLQPSPADELDRENAGAATFNFTKSMLVRADDRGICTDHAMLLLRQVMPCRFKKSDKRGGPGGRGRDRVIGFPGLCCRHCTTKNSFGRYFPVSAKNLTDNTTASIQGHVQSCSKCPDAIKASLAYLMHRSVLQKAELSGSWKKTFFKRVWDRLHVERAWSNADGDLREDGSVSSGGMIDFDTKIGAQGSASDSEDEEVTADMQDMIKAAALWLCEQEATNDPSSRGRATSRARLLPSKRTLPFSPQRRGRGGSLTAKRRRAVAI